MKKTSIHSIAATLVAAVLAAGIFSSCSGKKSDGDLYNSDEFSGNELMAALETKNLTRTSFLADSMALNVDELTNSESVAVLIAYLELHNDASLNNKKSSDLETLRKYVDVYELSMMRDSKGMESAIARAREINPELDLTALYNEFRGRLAEYDAVSGGELIIETPASEEEKSDSTSKADSEIQGSEDELPVEMRPAD